MSRADKAAAIFAQFIDQWPQDTNVPEARYLLALTLRQLGRTEEALTITLTLLLAVHLFLWEVYSPVYGFRLPWIST